MTSNGLKPFTLILRNDKINLIAVDEWADNTAYTKYRGNVETTGGTIMDQMGWLAWLIVGAIAGWLASIVMKSSGQQGLLMDIVVGIVGAFIGGFLFNQFGAAGVSGFNIWSVFVAFVGAIVLLAGLRLLTGRRVFS
jgi:uncharacterized membrane protein YeaQ/YmgE (transglycosylase-associated protein family)